MEGAAKNEAKRLYKIYGNLAIEVAEEIRSCNPNDAYFWDCVIMQIYRL